MSRHIVRTLLLTLMLSIAFASVVTAQEPEESAPALEESHTGVTVSADVVISALADIEAVLPVQGQLSNSAGEPLNTSVQMTFSLYDAPTGGTAICTTTKSVTVSSGYFDTTIDNCTTSNIKGTQLYLGIQVAGDTEMSPRRTIRPVAYSFSLVPGADVQGVVSNSSGLFVVNGGTSDLTSRSASRAIYGYSSAPSGRTRAVYGRAQSSNGIGVRGDATATEGVTYGLYGQVNSPDGQGVFGISTAQSDLNYGAWGHAQSNAGVGVRGSGPYVGVLGYGGAVYADPDAAISANVTLITSTTSIGVYGYTDHVTSTTYAVYGQADSQNLGYGVYGHATASTGETYGVYGKSDSEMGYGSYGYATSMTGTTYGVYGKSDSEMGYGSYGYATSMTGTTYGVYGKSDSEMGYGSYGYATSMTGTTYGVYGKSDSQAGVGVYGYASAMTGTTHGVYGKSMADGAGVYGMNSGSGPAIVAHSASGNPIEAYGSVITNAVFTVSNTGDVFADGGYHCGQAISATQTISTTALTPCLEDNNEADFAEMLPTSAQHKLEIGDVLAINQKGELVPTDRAYQATVVGVYSTRPSYLGNSQFWAQDGYAPLALVGIVPVKVSAENGAIQPGDMLTASDTAGHAMRADTDAPNGTVIGKALGTLDSGTGVIRMLVMLQ